MKGINFIFTLAVFLLLASCSSTDEKLRAMIPNDALGVVKINMPSVLEKAGIKNGDGADALSIPSELKQVIDQSNENIVDDVNILGDVIACLPSSGIDVNSNCYMFLSQGSFNAVALFHLDDNDMAQEMVNKIAGGKMRDMSGVMFASRLDYAFAIDDDVLMIARKINATDDKASADAKNIFDKSKSSLFENEDIAKAIDTENCDITAYVEARGLPLLFADSHFSTSFGDISPLDFIVESGIKAMTATVNFNDSKQGEEKVEIVTDFICSPSSVYSLFYDKVVATSKGGGGIETLEAVPGDFDTYFSIRVNGAELVKMPGVTKLLNQLPVKGIDCSKILSSLNGDIVWGFQNLDVRDIVFGVSAQSSSPDVIVDEIVNFATQHGQAPSFNASGEYQYDTSDGSKALVMNKKNDVVYLRYVNYVPNSSAAEWLPLVSTMKTSTMSLFKLIKVGDNNEGNLCWGLRNKNHGEGFYYTLDENENIVLSTLKFLCWRQPGTIDDEEIGLSDY
jgi:hypothetical protein